MFITLSKTIGKVGGVRIGVGKRITSKNAWWMLMLLAFGYTLQLMWYMCVLCFWLTYAVCYGMYWCGLKLVQWIISLVRKSKENKALVQADIQAIESNNQAIKIRYCDTCGQEIVEGNAFCVKCGARIE